MRTRYFDNAATSFPKPPGVVEAMARYMTENGAPGRGMYAGAREGGRLIRQCRERINRLVNGEDPDQVVFTHNTTDALNLAIKGTLAMARRTRPKSRLRIVSTWMEHNSVLRPGNAAIDADGDIEWVRIDGDPVTGIVDPDDFRREVRRAGEPPALVAVNHASNVTGGVQPVGEIGRDCREAGVMFLVDGAQSLGHIPVDVQAMNIDLLAFPGHKGLLGPTGTGGLYLRPGMEKLVATVREGGTGSASEHEVHPSTMPDRYEAGSHNIVGIVGLSEGVAWLLERGIDAVRRHEVDLMRAMLAGFAGWEAAGLRLLGPRDVEERVGVFSFVHDTLSPAEIAMVLETGYGVLTRAGLHCAPLAHRAFGTSPPAGRGAVRLSLGPFLMLDDVTFAGAALMEVCAEGRAPVRHRGLDPTAVTP